MEGMGEIVETAVGQRRIAFIGGGNMAGALIAGLLRGGVGTAQIRVGEPDAARQFSLQREFGVAAGDDNAAATQDADVVVLAVKPQEMPRVAAALAPHLATPAPLILSIAAGITTANLQRWYPGAEIVRTMPNRPALIGAGVSGLYAEETISPGSRGLAVAIMQAAGRVVWVRREADLDTLTALSGSGPAYFFRLAEAMAASGVALGLDPATAQLLAAETLYGAGQLVHADPSLDQQRAAVTSKGGTTEAALAEFDAGGLAALVQRAVKAAARRSADLARQFGTNG